MVKITATALQHPVRQLRENLGMTIPELARKAGVSPVVIYYIENFQPSYSITADVAEWVAGALGVQVDQVAWPCPVTSSSENSE